MAAAATDRTGARTPSRREIFGIAALLAAIAVTGAAAVAGLHRSVPPAPSTPRIGQTITPVAPGPPLRVEPGD